MKSKKGRRALTHFWPHILQQPLDFARPHLAHMLFETRRTRSYAARFPKHKIDKINWNKEFDVLSFSSRFFTPKLHIWLPNTNTNSCSRVAIKRNACLISLMKKWQSYVLGNIDIFDDDFRFSRPNEHAKPWKELQMVGISSHYQCTKRSRSKYGGGHKISVRVRHTPAEWVPVRSCGLIFGSSGGKQTTQNHSTHAQQCFW